MPEFRWLTVTEPGEPGGSFAVGFVTSMRVGPSLQVLVTPKVAQIGAHACLGWMSEIVEAPEGQRSMGFAFTCDIGLGPVEIKFGWVFTSGFVPIPS